MFAKTVIGGAIAATALLAAAPVAFASDVVPTQLNSGAATNVYQLTGKNVAVGRCPDSKAVFESSALTFGDYTYGVDTNHVQSTVFAKATLKPGIVAGAYKLTMTCGKQTVSTTFTVPGQQVTKKPVGAPQTGGGATATVFE
jgi:hypothetical protein